MNTLEAPAINETIAMLSSYGACGEWNKRHLWRDYADFSLTEGRIAALRSILKLEHEAQLQDEAWVHVHAWRILATAKVTAALPDLIEHLYMLEEEDDWGHEDLPDAIAMFGAVAIPLLRAQLLEQVLHREDLWSHGGFVRALELIGRSQPELASGCCAILRELLAEFALNCPSLNAFAVCSLVELHDESALPLIRRIFEEDFVAERVIDWAFVRTQFPEQQLPENVERPARGRLPTEYCGDDRFQRLLKALGSASNVDEVKCYALGSILSIEMSDPIATSNFALQTHDEEEVRFETKAQAEFYYHNFNELWNRMAAFQNQPYLLSAEIAGSDSPGCEGMWMQRAALFQTAMQIGSFLSGFDAGNPVNRRSLNDRSRRFVEWIGETEESILSSSGTPEGTGAETALARLREIRERWNAEYLPFAEDCLSARLRIGARRDFLRLHRETGRNDPCPCGSGKKFKRCCLG